MPLRRSNGSTSIKRDRSPSSSLSPPPAKPKAVRPRPSKTLLARKEPEDVNQQVATSSAVPSSPPPVKPKAAKVPRPVKKPKAKVERGEAPNDEKNLDAAVPPPTNGDVPASPPAKKARIPKVKPWPPPDLAPDKHPARAGLPPYSLPALTVPPNGGIGSSSSVPSLHLVGAHVSIGGGIGGALLRAGMAGANALAMFTKSQRQWKSIPFEAEGVERFRGLMRSKEEGGIGYARDSILVHGSYLINLANPDPVKWDTSYECFRDDISRCYQLGIKLYNWHPGSTTGACTREESYASIAKAINRVHQDVPEVVCVVENMANANSNIIGTTFHDLSSIISLVSDKTRVRICLDTCHLFAAGFDIRTPDSYAEVMRRFNDEVGNGYLGGMHLNDSKGDLGGCKDLHENVGLGKIGLSAFRSIMRDPLMAGIPLILETPAPEKALEFSDLAIWAREIKLLYEIQGIEDDEWVTREAEIEKRWRAERDVLNPPKAPKEQKEKEKKEKGKVKGEKKVKGAEKVKKTKKAKKGEEVEEEEEEGGDQGEGESEGNEEE